MKRTAAGKGIAQGALTGCHGVFQASPLRSDSHGAHVDEGVDRRNRSGNRYVGTVVQFQGFLHLVSADNSDVLEVVVVGSRAIAMAALASASTSAVGKVAGQAVPAECTLRVGRHVSFIAGGRLVKQTLKASFGG